jgi:hypothetical protein
LRIVLKPVPRAVTWIAYRAALKELRRNYADDDAASSEFVGIGSRHCSSRGGRTGD